HRRSNSAARNGLVYCSRDRDGHRNLCRRSCSAARHCDSDARSADTRSVARLSELRWRTSPKTLQRCAIAGDNLLPARALRPRSLLPECLGSIAEARAAARSHGHSTSAQAICRGKAGGQPAIRRCRRPARIDRSRAGDCPATAQAAYREPFPSLRPARRVFACQDKKWRQNQRVIFVRCRSEEHTSELQSHLNLVCRLLLEKKKIINIYI